MNGKSHIVVSLAGNTNREEVLHRFQLWAESIAPDARVAPSSSRGLVISTGSNNLPLFQQSFKNATPPSPPFFNAFFPVGQVPLRDCICSGSQEREARERIENLRPITAVPGQRTDLLNEIGKYDWEARSFPPFDY